MNFKKIDIIVIAAVLCASAISFGVFYLLGQGSGEMEAEIYVDGELKNTLALPETEQIFYINTENGYNIIVLDGEGVKMTDADCPSLDCVHSPKIKRPGEVIACLPHRVIVKLAGAVSAGESGVDAVAG